MAVSAGREARVTALAANQNTAERLFLHADAYRAGIVIEDVVQAGGLFPILRARRPTRH